MKRLSEILAHPHAREINRGSDGAAFQFWPPGHTGSKPLRVIASNGGGWDHVSVSCAGMRTPTWAEMDAVKRLCFRPDEVAMQLHPAESDHISIKHNCLHLWRPQSATIPLPPKVMV